MGLTVKGERRAINNLVRAPAKFKAALPRAMHMAAVLLVQKTKDGIMNGSKTGRIYKIGGRSHQASAPGEYSAYLSGEHFHSIDYDVQGLRQFEFGAGASYSAYLELGTSRMEPREDLGQSVRSEQAAVTNILGQQPFIAISR